MAYRVNGIQLLSRKDLVRPIVSPSGDGRTGTQERSEGEPSGSYVRAQPGKEKYSAQLAPKELKPENLRGYNKYGETSED